MSELPPPPHFLHVKEEEEEENFHFHSLIFFPFCACQVRMKSVWQPPIKEEEKYIKHLHIEKVREKFHFIGKGCPAVSK